VAFDAEETTEFAGMVAEKINADDQAAVRTAVRNITLHFAKKWAGKIQNFQIKSIWLNGLLQPYADIARAQDKDKELGALIDKVQAEGAIRIHRSMLGKQSRQQRLQPQQRRQWQSRSRSGIAGPTGKNGNHRRSRSRWNPEVLQVLQERPGDAAAFQVLVLGNGRRTEGRREHSK